jgi:hypothetical protein
MANSTQHGGASRIVAVTRSRRRCRSTRGRDAGPYPWEKTSASPTHGPWTSSPQPRPVRRSQACSANWQPVPNYGGQRLVELILNGIASPSRQPIHPYLSVNNQLDEPHPRDRPSSTASTRHRTTSTPAARAQRSNSSSARTSSGRSRGKSKMQSIGSARSGSLRRARLREPTRRKLQYPLVTGDDAAAAPRLRALAPIYKGLSGALKRALFP